MGVEFQDFRVKVKGALDDAVISYLYEAGGEIEAQVKQNTTTKNGTGQLKNSWTYRVDEAKGVCTIGSPLENAIWTEFGTGEYALNNDGRKGGWRYQDEKGKWHHTYGKKPLRMFHNAYVTLKSALIRRAEQVLKGSMK